MASHLPGASGRSSKSSIFVDQSLIFEMNPLSHFLYHLWRTPNLNRFVQTANSVEMHIVNKSMNSVKEELKLIGRDQSGIKSGT